MLFCRRSFDFDDTSESGWSLNPGSPTTQGGIDGNSLTRLAYYNTSNGTDFVDIDGDGNKEDTDYCQRR